MHEKEKTSRRISDRFSICGCSTYSPQCALEATAHDCVSENMLHAEECYAGKTNMDAIIFIIFVKKPNAVLFNDYTNEWAKCLG